ncbi:MAG: nuclear transport factor 2 family protein [Acidobacteria bacterium]|nr:nuclear transport factor 2 family protein [Acidobacteriota bacterium]MBI3426302.1 nuclear transport factor 2 family protein [Acidobacteriota bacterium]
MKSTLLAVGLATIAASFSACAASGEKASSTPAPAATVAAETPAETAAKAEQEVRQIGREYDKAWLQQDAAAFEKLLADDAVLTDETGKASSKAEVIANAKSGAVKFEVGHSDDVKIHVYGNTVVTSGRWTEKSTNKGKPVNGTMQGTTVYVKRNGAWQVVADHVTLIKAPKSKP